MATEVKCGSCGRTLGGRRVYYIVCPKNDCIEILCRTCRDWSRVILRPEEYAGYDARFSLKLSNPPTVRGES